MGWVTFFFVGLVVSGGTNAVPLRLFYPFGESRGDSSLLRSDDFSSSEIQLRTPIHFYNGFYTSIFVNSNGHLSFESELPSYQATLVIPLDRGIKLISAFMSDISVNVAGNIYYRESTEEALLQRAAREVQDHFSGFPLFEPFSVFIATWDGVAAYQGNNNQVNTFQIVIASDELNSFAVFNYLDNGIQWTKSAGKLKGIQDDPPGQAGFDSGSGRLHLKLPYSGTNRVQLLTQESNVNEPGQWMFRIGDIRKDENIEGPDTDTGDVEIFTPEVENPTCLQGSRTCHSNARCVDYEEGFCCECIPPSFGNGLQCITPDKPQRLNGKVSGNLNGIEFEDLDTHAVVRLEDGRVYLAISRVPQEVGSYILTLSTISGVLGWLFAIPEGDQAINGYMYTGGKFTREANIEYRSGGAVTILQTFYGYDALDNSRMETYVNGTVPDIGASFASITVDDYVEKYKRVSAGIVKSFSERTYRIDNDAFVYTWDQTILFDECAATSVMDQKDTMRLQVSKNFLSFNNNVVRFSSTNKIAVHTGFDPCQEGATTCHENADCTPSGDSFTCSCRTGFIGDGLNCQDLNECEMGLNTCSDNARCYNVPGSFQCRCNPGFRGDGRTCSPEVASCGLFVCSEYARCVYDDVQEQAVCECRNGYMGDGTYCTPVVFDCNEADICDENAECIYSAQENRYVCECVEGFSGDGEYCERYRRPSQCNCAPNADCVLQQEFYYRCICSEGYTGDGVNYCTEIRDYSSVNIDCDQCHPDASCVEGYVEGQLRRECRCNSGFVGNGINCEPVHCGDADICDSNARCSQSDDGQFLCQCLPGYTGNGYRCEQEGCNVLNNCAREAECVADPRDTSRYLCRCNPGYSGDGYVCVRRVIPCNEVNNCGNNGECVYDPESLSYRCRCERGYEGDGFTCHARGSDCRRDPSLCDPNASCILNVDRFECVCNPNYRGDGAVCIAMVDGENYLLFSRGYSLHKVPYNLNGEDKDGTRVLYVPDELAIGVASDCAEQKFYWTDVTYGRVSSAGIDGLDQKIITQGFQSPEGIAIDFLARTLYVTDSGLDIIAVVNLNGTYRKTIVSDNLDNPRAIVLDPQRGVMYWTDWYRYNPTIEKANMDGSDRQVFVDTDLGLPNGLTMDTYTQQICWGDAGMGRIECIRSDGIGRRIITEEAPHPFDITMYGDSIYWSDWTIRGVPSVEFNGGEVKDPLPLPIGGNGRLYGITSVGEFCPRVTNACYRSNGGCRYLCLPTPNGGRTCACPDDIDEVTCSEIGFVKKRK